MLDFNLAALMFKYVLASSPRSEPDTIPASKIGITRCYRDTVRLSQPSLM